MILLGDDRVPYQYFLKWVGTRAPGKIRLLRLVWCVLPGPGAHGGYTAKLTLALVPKWFSIFQGHQEWRWCFLGVEFHYLRSYGGWIA